MNTKIIIIIILILILFMINMIESFSSADVTTHYLVLDDGRTADKYTLTNYIYTSEESSAKPNFFNDKKMSYFKNLYVPFGQHFFSENEYSLQEKPRFIMESNKECPVLYNLYKGLEKLDEFGLRDERQIEDVNGLNFRSKLQSVFHNISKPLMVEYPLFELNTQEKKSLIDNKPQIKFRIKEDNNSKLIKSIKSATETDNFIVPEITGENTYNPASKNTMSYLNANKFFTLHKNFEISFDFDTDAANSVATAGSSPPNILKISRFKNNNINFDLQPPTIDTVNSENLDLFLLTYSIDTLTLNCALGEIKDPEIPTVGPINLYYYNAIDNRYDVGKTYLNVNNLKKVIIEVLGNYIKITLKDNVGEKIYNGNTFNREDLNDVVMLMNTNVVSNFKYRELEKNPNNNSKLINYINTTQSDNLIVPEIDDTIYDPETKKYTISDSKANEFFTLHKNFEISFDYKYTDFPNETEIFNFVQFSKSEKVIFFTKGSVEIKINDNNTKNLFHFNYIRGKGFGMNCRLGSLKEDRTAQRGSKFAKLYKTGEFVEDNYHKESFSKVIITVYGNYVKLTFVETNQTIYHGNFFDRKELNDIVMLINTNVVSNFKYRELEKNPNNNSKLINYINTTQSNNLIVPEIDDTIYDPETKKYTISDSKANEFFTLHKNFEISFDYKYTDFQTQTEIFNFVQFSKSKEVIFTKRSEKINVHNYDNLFNFNYTTGNKFGMNCRLGSLKDKRGSKFAKLYKTGEFVGDNFHKESFSKVIITVYGNYVKLTFVGDTETIYYGNFFDRKELNDIVMLINTNVVSNFKYKRINPKAIDYIDDKSSLESFNNKEATFGVKENFEIQDLLRFGDYCFTSLCWGAIHIDLMKLVKHHYYVFPCQNPKCGTVGNPIYFYVLPVRVKQICYDENRKYTRAKCNKCASNVIVFFNTLPSKFRNLEVIQKEKYIPNLI